MSSKWSMPGWAKSPVTFPRTRAAQRERAPGARSVHGRDRQVQHILDRAPAHRAAQRLAAAPLQPAATACCGVGGGGLARAGVAAGAAAARGCVLLRQRRRVQTLSSESSAIVSHRQRKASTREWRARGVPARIRRRRRGGCRGAARSPSAPSGISRTERPSVSPTKKQPTNIIRSSPQHFVMACRAGEGCVKDGPASRWSRCAPAPARPPARALARGTAAAHPC